MHQIKSTSENYWCNQTNTINYSLQKYMNALKIKRYKLLLIIYTVWLQYL